MTRLVAGAERRVAELRALPLAEWPTRDRILLEASRLFAAHGYRGASTRAIAERVGVRQPTLFKHFESKQAMLTELTVYDMHVPALHAQRSAADEGSAADRLAAYLAWDFEWYRTMPLDLRGISEALVRNEGLVAADRALARWNRAINLMLRQGVESGEFISGATRFVPTVVETLSWHMVMEPDAGEATVDDGVRFVLGAVLRRDLRR
jgi:AcrR family transcriptional regulator